jgi:hypothetical protein
VLDFDADRNQWFVVGVNEQACWPTPEQYKAGHLDSTGRINVHPNIEYRLINSQWQEVEIGPDRLGRKANLLVNRSTIDDWKSCLSPRSSGWTLEGNLSRSGLSSLA